MKKLNNKILIIVLLVLAAVFVFSRIFRASSREGNLPKELVSVDTASVTEIKIYPSSEKNKEIRLVREGKKWSAKMESRSADAELGSVLSALNNFIHLKPLRLVSKKKAKWSEFHVGDTSTRVKLFKDNEVLADLRVGKIGFSQQPGQQQFTADGVFTYVRLSDQDEVYTVQGFLESSFNRSYNDWRDKSFLRVRQEQVTKITFTYPADSGFVVEKRDKKWWVNNTEADSVKVKGYIAQLAFKNASDFADDFHPNGNSQAVIQINSSAGSLATIQAWKRITDWAVNSTHQSKVYFSSKGLESVLEKKKHFLPEAKKK
ncbi:MAG TPA: hypothetical protein DGG95_12465 [Cytophagales bacterium]|jgi:hypothetical protein|nr:hypothetical protein [Cytophagales bacterium]